MAHFFWIQNELPKSSLNDMKFNMKSTNLDDKFKHASETELEVAYHEFALVKVVLWRWKVAAVTCGMISLMLVSAMIFGRQQICIPSFGTNTVSCSPSL